LLRISWKEENCYEISFL